MNGERELIAVAAGDYWPEDAEEDEGVVVNWFATEGREIEDGESICEIQIEKVSVDVPAPASGTLAEIERDENDEITPADTLGWIDPA